MDRYRNPFTQELCYAGPVYLKDSGLHPPQRQRRILGSSRLDGRTFHGDSEIFNEDFRCGGPLLAPLPAITEEFSSDDHPLLLDFMRRLDKPVRNICHKWGIVLDQGNRLNPNLVLRGCPGIKDTPAPNGWLETAIIYAKSGEIDHTWFKACKEIRQLFRERGKSTLNVEIIDYSRSRERLKAYPLTTDGKMLRSWHDVRRPILNVLEGKEWVILYPSCRQDTREPQRIDTISIAVKEESNEDWTVCLEQIVEILDGKQCYSVAVEIHHGSSQPSATSSSDSSPSDWSSSTPCMDPIERCREPVSPRQSVLGYVEGNLQDAPWKELAVTFHDSVMPQRRKEVWEKRGLMPDESQNEPTVYIPSCERCEPAPLNVRNPESSTSRFASDMLVMLFMNRRSRTRTNPNQLFFDWDFGGVGTPYIPHHI
ncbi:hypothetical protein FQN49_005441 [Arthroderma sp. PD_2]|nr:hypothetical protein FQN49_005441 [Arthroderma sp. PD_2]